MMAIYDRFGNMQNEQAAEVASDVAHQVGELFEALFDAGQMTVLEARGLLGYIQSQISMAGTLCFLRQQIAKNGNPVSVAVHGRYPACLDKDCMYKSDCANHTTAGDFRTEGGATPDLVKTDLGWQCNRNPGETGHGAILTDGSYIGGTQ